MNELHSDQPFLPDEGHPDLLRREQLLNQVVGAIQNCQMPIVFGIHGDWGQGKTSFMLQARAALEIPNCEYPCKVVWFEAWRYQNESAPVIALLQEIRRELGALALAKGGIEKLTSVTIRGALLSIEEVTKAIGFQASKVEQAGREWEKERLVEQLSADQIRNLLDSAISAVLESLDTSHAAGSPRLVVMIDDLDRCERGAAFRLLEGLKLYLNLNHCVFVIGMNKRIVEDAIACEFSKEMRERTPDTMRAAAYMEKICQTIWNLPSVSDPAAFLRCHLLALPEPVQNAIFYVTRIDQPLPPNPRRLKALANAILVLHHRIWNDQSFPLEGEGLQEARALVFMAFLTQGAPDLYRLWQFYGVSFFQTVWNWVTADLIALKYDDKFQATAMAMATSGLGVPYLVSASERSERTLMQTYKDPSDASVLWVQPMLIRAVDEDENEKQTHAARCARYL